MNDNDAEDLIKSIFPVGKERWIKVMYTDFEKCKQYLRLSSWKRREDAIDLGFEVTALGIKDEYLPQASALLDVKDEIVTYLFGNVEDYRLNQIRYFFDAKIQEIKDRTIITE